MGVTCGKEPKIPSSKNLADDTSVSKEQSIHHTRRQLHKRWSELLEADIISDSIRVDSPYGSSTALDNILLDYKFGECIGEGSVGKVKKAYLISFPKMVFAVKIIKKTRENDKNFKYFKTEVDTLKELDHPHIVRFFECYHDTQNHYTVMELCQGPVLVRLVEKTKGLPENLVRKFAYQALCAVNYLHHVGVAHRDIKLDNFMLTSKDLDKADLKLIDFGLSSSFRDNRLKSHVGTPWYLAPEVLRKSEGYTEACDAWSLGVMFYIMVTGEQPFKGRNNNEIYTRILEDPVSFEHKKLAAASPDCLQLILALLQKDPKVRVSPTQALQSAWFNPIVEGLHRHWGPASAKFVIARLKSARPLGPFRKEVTRLVSKMFHDAKEVRELAVLFGCCDYINNGVITPIEFQQLCKEAGEELSLDETNGILEKIYSANEKVISFSGFVAACLDPAFFADPSRLKVVFDRIDVNNSQFIKEDNLKDSFKRFGYRLTQPTIKSFMAEFHAADGQGIDFPTFVKEMAAQF